MTRSARLKTVFGAFALATLASSSAARAEGVVPPIGPRNLASFSVFAIFGPGFGVEYERYLPRYVSFASGFGFRKTGGPQYTAVTLTPSVEARVWVLGHGVFSDLGKRAMVGPFVALREDVSWTILEDDARRKLAGTAVELSESLGFGYRLTLSRFALTEEQSFALTTQLDPRGRLATTTYPSAKLALNLGVFF